jgi:hypothetical protein
MRYLIDEVLIIWKTANIPTTQKPNAVSKLKALYQQHVCVGKNKARQTGRQRQLENNFSELTERIFDISHARSDNIIRIDEDQQFLVHLRQDRKMIMGAEDQMFKKMEENRQKRKQEEAKRQEKAKKTDSDHIHQHDQSVYFVEDGEISTEVTDEDEDAEFEISQYHVLHITATAKATLTIPTNATSETTTMASTTITPIMFERNINKRCLIDDPLFVASLDRTNTTPRQAMHIIAPAFKAVGVNVNVLTLCTTSMYEARKKARVAIEDGVRDGFCPKTPLVAHFDGKLLPDNKSSNVDRMPVVVSGKGIEKLLAIPKLHGSGTGVLMGGKLLQSSGSGKEYQNGLLDCVLTLQVQTQEFTMVQSG